MKLFEASRPQYVQTRLQSGIKYPTQSLSISGKTSSTSTWKRHKLIKLFPQLPVLLWLHFTQPRHDNSLWPRGKHFPPLQYPFHLGVALNIRNSLVLMPSTKCNALAVMMAKKEKYGLLQHVDFQSWFHFFLTIFLLPWRQKLRNTSPSLTNFRTITLPVETQIYHHH